MTTGADRDSERFAAALERGVPHRGAVPPGDEMLHRDLDLVALLQESRSSLAPSADASARMRAKVMAAAATMLPEAGAGPSETTAPTQVVATEPVRSETGSETAVLDTADEGADNVVPIGSARGRHRFPARLRSSESPHRRSALGVSAAAALMVLAVTGGGALFSQDALPGDTLYGVKQTTESGMLALTPGQGNKAQRQLDYAATRLDEAEALNSNQTASADRGGDISQALRGFDEQATAGSRMWLTGGSGNTGELANWASTQSQRLSALRTTMPASAQPDADKSLRVLEQMRTRATALSSRKGCDSVTSGESDEFGPLPAKGSCVTKDSTPQTRQVVPSTPTRERVSNPSSVVPETSRSTQSPSTRDNGPALELPDLPGSDGDLGPLPGREPTTGDNDTVPEVPAEEPSTGLGGVLKDLLGR